MTVFGLQPYRDRVAVDHFGGDFLKSRFGTQRHGTARHSSVCANKHDGLSKGRERLGVAQSVAAFPNYCQPVQVYKDTHNVRISQANIYIYIYIYI
jgi:hypothetical protein